MSIKAFTVTDPDDKPRQREAALTRDPQPHPHTTKTTETVKSITDTEDETRQRFQDYASNNAAYTPIANECLIPGSRVPFNVYSLQDQSLITVCSGSLMSPGVIRGDLTQNSGHLCIESTELLKYTGYLSKVMENHAPSSSVGMVVLQEKSKIVMKDVFDGALDDEKIKAVTETANDMVECILMRDEVLSELLTIKRHDFQNYVHSVNVAVLSLSLGKTLGLNRETLQYLGIGAFLHDIGKREVPKEILGKIGLLTEAEYKVYKRHVLEGVKILESAWKIPSPSIAAVSQHHERVNGTGYPNGISDRQIGIFGRIMSIADCFDNLTSPRPNKSAVMPFDAVKVLADEKGHFDQQILMTFIKLLGRSN
ncbi:MAG: HD-GYP domain-containing protein [Dissulfurispiraceae bacterium]